MRVSGMFRWLLKALAVVALAFCWKRWGVYFGPRAMYRYSAPGQTISLIVTIAGGTIAVWWLGVRMRHRIKRALGINVHSEEELTSLNTWMKVEDVEEKKKEGKVS